MHTYTHTLVYYSAFKNKEHFSLVATWMNLEDIVLNAISQVKKDKHCAISLICGIYSSPVGGEYRVVTARSWAEGATGRCWLTGTKFQLCEIII